MPIEIQCTNIVSFDRDTGQYVHCNHVIKVPSEKAGLTVQCPKCGGSVQATPSQPEDLTPATASSSPVDELLNDEAPVPPPTSSPTLQATPQAAPRSLQSQIKCINCHAPMERGTKICPSCNYQQPVAEVADVETGFRGALGQQLTEGTSPWFVLALAAGGMALLMFSCVVCCNGRTAMIVFGTPVALAALLLIVLLFLHRRPAEPWSASIVRVVHPWKLLLLLMRMRWQMAGAGPTMLDRRLTQFADNDLVNTKGLTEFKIIDLEGTQITDQGLQYLYGMPNLRYLVLENTQVTPQAVQNLQRELPKVWIWV